MGEQALTDQALHRRPARDDPLSADADDLGSKSAEPAFGGDDACDALPHKDAGLQPRSRHAGEATLAQSGQRPAT